MHTVVKHKISHLLVDHQQAATLPSPENMVNRVALAATAYGGTVNDWEVVQIADEVWTGINLKAELTAVLTNGQVTGIIQSTPPLLSKVEGVNSVTINLAAGAYNDEVKWTCYSPTGTVTSATSTAVNGADSWEIETSTGTYLVQAIVPGLGVGEVSFEGV